MVAIAATTAAAADDIVVAVAGPMTGQYEAFGRAMKRGASWAIDALNRADGIDGRHLRLIVEDDACDRSQAVSAAARLVKLQAALVVGHHCASASIAAAPVYAAAGIIMISPGTTDPALTVKRAGSSIFRLAPRRDREGAAIGAYIARVFAAKRIAILHDRTVVGIQIAVDTKKAMNAGGLVEALYSGFIAGEKDYSQLARDMRAFRADVVFLAAYPSEAALILTALRREGLSTVLVGTTLLDTLDFTNPVHALLDARVIQPEGFLIDTRDQKIGDIGPSDYRAERAKVFSYSYAAVQVFAQSAKVAAAAKPGSTSAAAYTQTGTFKTMTGDFGFDKNGDATLPFYKMFSWKDGDNVAPAP